MNRCLPLRTLLKLALYLGLWGLLFGCSSPQEPKPPVQATTQLVKTQISTTTDDAEEFAAGNVVYSSVTLELANDTADDTLGLRFTNLKVPQGAKIVDAYVQFTAYARHSKATSLTLQGQAADDTLTFGPSPYDLTERPKTKAVVAWSPEVWSEVGAAGLAQRTPNLSAIVQEIVGRPGWLSGNDLVLFVAGAGKRIATAYDGSEADAPQLYVVFDDSVKVDRFAATPTPVEPGQEVIFSWSATSRNGDALGCQLDVDNDGSPEYELEDCQTQTSLSHSYALPGLYTARFTATNPAHASTSVITPVTVAYPDTVTVAAAGDIACDPADKYFNGGAGTAAFCRMKDTSDLLLALDPDAVLTLGDNQYDEGTLDKFMQSYDPTWGRLKNITYPSLGTHEYLSQGAAGYFDYFGAAAGDPAKGYYSFDLGAWHIVVLNSHCSKSSECGAGAPQEQWLRTDLAAHPTTCTLAVLHTPRFSSGIHGNNEDVAPLWQALYEGGAEVLLSGNDHDFERFAPQNVEGKPDPEGLRQFVAGTGGKELYTVRQPASQ